MIKKECILFLLLILFFSTPTYLFSQLDNSIIIREKAGVTTSNYPIQIARPFVKGEISNFPQVVIDGTPMLTQADVKIRWDDGSVRHAVITFYIPQLQANDVLTVSFINQNSAQQNNFLLPQQMLDSMQFNFDGVMSLHTYQDSIHYLCT